MNLWDLLSEFTGNFDSVIQVLDIKMSRELIGLPSQFIVTDPKSLVTAIGIWYGFNLIDDAGVATPPVTFNFDGSSHSN